MSKTDTARLCGCSRPARDGYALCDTCRSELEQHFAETSWLVTELETARIRSKGIDYRVLGGTKSNETPMPFDQRASRAEQTLKAELVGWVRILHVGDEVWPKDRLTSIAAWMLGHLEGIAKHDEAAVMFDQITLRYQQARALVFFKPEEKRLIGNCDGRIDDDGHEITEHPCDGLVYALATSAIGECDQCRREHDANEKRAQLLMAMDDRLVGLREATRLIGYLALDVKPETMRSQLNRWIDKGIIAARSHDVDGNPTYRFGEVRDTLIAHYIAKRA